MKEAHEETGYHVQAQRLLALFNTKNHPPQPWYMYQAFVLCKITGGNLLADTRKTTGAGWFREKEITTLALSTNRATASLLTTLFEFARQP